VEAPTAAIEEVKRHSGFPGLALLVAGISCPAGWLWLTYPFAGSVSPRVGCHVPTHSAARSWSRTAILCACSAKRPAALEAAVSAATLMSGAATRSTSGAWLVLVVLLGVGFCSEGGCCS
jgi:hypothetical protein